MAKMFKQITPGIGKVTFDKGVKVGDKRTEVRILRWMVGKYGGNYRILPEIKQHGIKTPDAIRNNKELIEVKRSKSLTSFKNRLSEAVQQLLYKNNKIAKIPAKYVVIEASGRLLKEKQAMIKEIKLRTNGKEMNEIAGVIIKQNQQSIEIKF